MEREAVQGVARRVTAFLIYVRLYGPKLARVGCGAIYLKVTNVRELEYAEEKTEASMRLVVRERRRLRWVDRWR